jgi:N-acetylglucosamine kinase-like BadF-type ATPase
MEAMDYFVGVDGGGTKTVGLLVDPKGHVLARAVVGPTNYQIIGAEGIRKEIPRLVAKLFDRTGQPQQHLTSIALGLAGVGRPGEPETVAELVRELDLAERVVVDHDAMIALVGALGDQPGLVVIAGTGSIVLGRNTHGDRVRVGGWGYLLGDEGSGFFIARAALVAIMRAYDGRGSQTILTASILKVLGLKNPQEIIPRVYRQGMSHTEIADLAPVVFQAARQEDAVARTILDDAGQELGMMMAAAIRKLEMQGEMVKIGLVGSLFKSRDLLLGSIRSGLGDKIRAEFLTPRLEPASGAALLALKAARVPIDPQLLATLERDLRKPAT